MKIAEIILAKLYEKRSRNHHYRLAQKEVIKLKEKSLYIKHPLSNHETIVGNHKVLKYKEDLLWFDIFYSINGVQSNSYVPLNLFYRLIEPTLNHRLMVSTLKDKNFYELYYKEVDYPKVLFRGMNGFIYGRDYQRINSFENLRSLLETIDKFVFKASLASGSGKYIYLFRRKGSSFYCDSIIFDEAFLKRMPKDFVVQEVVEQHPFFKKFNPDSNNTIRVLIYRSVRDDSINILHTLLRIGAKGSFLDHDDKGGMSIAIDEGGVLKDSGFDGEGKRLFEFNGIVFKDIGKIPFIDDVISAAKAITEKTFYARLLALDFTVNSVGNALLLDLNCWRNGITHYQLNSGTLFSDFTEEILDYCEKNKSFNILRVPIL